MIWMISEVDDDYDDDYGDDDDYGADDYDDDYGMVMMITTKITMMTIMMAEKAQKKLIHI